MIRRSKFPYVVEIAGSVRSRKVAMHYFHVRLGIEAHPMKEISKYGPYNRWCFASLADAERFAHQFGGSLVAG